MPSSNGFGNSDFGYSDAGVTGSGYQSGPGQGQGGVQDAPPINYAEAPAPAGLQNGPGQFNPQGNQNPYGYQPTAGPFNYQASPNPFGQGQPGNQPSPNPFGPGQPGNQPSPNPFGQGQAGYLGTPTPIGYQDPSQFGQPAYGSSRMWSAAGASGIGIGGGIGRALLSILVGPGAFRRRGRNRYFWYIRIAFWLIVIGICLYVGFTKHTWITTCTGDCGGD